jgi:hypothetical protein
MSSAVAGDFAHPTIMFSTVGLAAGKALIAVVEA